MNSPRRLAGCFVFWSLHNRAFIAPGKARSWRAMSPRRLQSAIDGLHQEFRRGPWRTAHSIHVPRRAHTREHRPHTAAHRAGVGAERVHLESPPPPPPSFSVPLLHPSTQHSSWEEFLRGGHFPSVFVLEMGIKVGPSSCSFDFLPYFSLFGGSPIWKIHHAL